MDRIKLSVAALLTAAIAFGQPTAGSYSAPIGVRADGTTIIAAPSGIISTAGGLQFATISLSDVQINGIFATPLQVIAAPGAGKVIAVDKVFFNAIFGSAAFTGGGPLELIYGTSVASLASATLLASFLTTFAANQVAAIGGAAGLKVTSANAVNQAISITNTTGAFAAGTGASVVISIWYRGVSGVA